MTTTTGLIIEGSDGDDELLAKDSVDDNDDWSIYNIIRAGDGNDRLDGSQKLSWAAQTTYGVQLYGEGGNDRLVDSGGSDTLSGGAGNDQISYSAGRDVIDGGNGKDTLSLLSRTLPDTLSVSGVEELDVFGDVYVTGFDLDHFTVVRQMGTQSASFVFLKQTDVEGVKFAGNYTRFTGSQYDDVIDLSTTACSVTIDGGDGNDTLFGGNRADTVFGNIGDDVIYAGGGRDQLEDKGGNNTLDGGDGNDLIKVENGDDRVAGGNGNDRLYLWYGSYIADAGAGNDLIEIRIKQAGDEQTVTVDGGEGDDRFYTPGRGPTQLVLHGGDGEDVLYDGADGNLTKLKADGIELLVLDAPKLMIGADTLGSFEKVNCGRIVNLDNITFHITLTSGGQFLWHAAGHAPKFATVTGSGEEDKMDFGASHTRWTVHGRDGDDTIADGGIGSGLYGDGGNDTLVGYGRGDVLNGGDGDDVLIGSAGGNALIGGSGNDELVAGAGLNEIHGNRGSDRFVFADGVGGAIIYDFRHNAEESDILDFSHVTTIKNFNDLMAHHVKMIDDGLALEITYGTSEIALVGVKSGDLHKADFHF